MNASQVDGDQLAGFNKLGLTGGIKVASELQERWDLNIEFLYSQRGSRQDIFQPQFDPEIRIDLKYIELPVYISFKDWLYEDSYYKVSVHGGLSYGRLMSASTFDQFDEDEAELDLLVDEFNKNDLSWLLGASFYFNENLGLTIRYTRYITPLWKAPEDSSGLFSLRSYFITFRTEYKF